MPIATSQQLQAFETAPLRIAEAIAGLSEAQLQVRPATREWNIHEVIIHLADSEVVGFWRIRKTLAEPGSTIQLYDEEAWAKQLSYRTQDRQLALSLFTALRASTAALLRSLSEEAWARRSVHPEYGQISVYDLFDTYIKHSDIHLQQIESLKLSSHI